MSCLVHAGGPTTTTTTPVQIDAERAASAFVSQAAISYKGGSYLEQTMPNGSFTWVSSRFTFVDGKITQMTISSASTPNGVEITIPEGDLPGFPRNFVGENRNFSIWLEGYTESGVFASYGSYSKQLFLDNDNIVIQLRPSDRLKKFVFPENQIPAGVSPDNLTLEYASTWGASTVYDKNLGGFWLYVDPLVDGTYTLVDKSTGFVYPFDPNSATPAVQQYAGLNTTYEGGPVKIDFGSQTSVGYYSVYLDTVVKRNGNFVPAKTYFTDLQGIYGLYISVNNFVGKIEVFSVDADGTKTLVKTAEVATDSNQNWATVQVYAGYGPVVITFTGGNNAYPGGSYFQFQRDDKLFAPVSPG